MKYTLRSGFTLIELLVVIAIIGILAAVVVANMSGAGGQGRDAKRQSDLRNLEAAVEAYKHKNGRYPVAGCGVPAGRWAIESAASCANSDYIVGLAPEFISTLPNDPKLVSGASGYAYRTNTTGTVFKLQALNTVESETVTATNEFKNCDIGTGGFCLPASGVCRPSDTQFQNTYAVWGGYADALTPALVRSGTVAIICQ